MSKRPVALIIMDGFGYNPDAYGNAIRAAKKPNLEKYLKGPHTLIGASGLDVGLPDGQMGNSEVGHTNIGAGRIVYQCSSFLTVLVHLPVAGNNCLSQCLIHSKFLFLPTAPCESLRISICDIISLFVGSLVVASVVTSDHNAF